MKVGKIDKKKQMIIQKENQQTDSESVCSVFVNCAAAWLADIILIRKKRRRGSDLKKRTTMYILSNTWDTSVRQYVSNKTFKFGQL